MTEISLTTLFIIAGSKIILLVGGGLGIWLAVKKKSPVYLSIVAAVMLTALGLLILWPLQKMWWGTSGDELFVAAFFTRVIQGSLGQDFYYAWLPPFYPPFYFWLFGAVGGLLNLSTLWSIKVGILATLSAWFIIPALARLDYLRLAAEPKDEILSSASYWFLTPLLFLAVVDFDNLLFKPYEVLPALLCVIYLGLFAAVLGKPKWSWSEYSWFIIVGAILFLTFYFWWFILGPTLIVLACLISNRRQSLMRALIVLSSIFILALPFSGPLLISFWQYGLESWQAYYFVPADLTTFVPWSKISLATPLLLGGLVSLAWFWQKPFIKSLALALAGCYFYQIINISLLLIGQSPAQSAKPFLFLGTAILTTASAYGLVHLANSAPARLLKLTSFKIYGALALLILPLSPFIRFMDDPLVWRQIEIDLEGSDMSQLAERLKRQVPQYQEIVWLTSGAPELNMHLPLTYYVAFNPHFSHPAVGYTARLNKVKELAEAKSVDGFSKIINSAEPPITGLLFYYDSQTKTWPIFFWEDNWPNGGQELRLDIRPEFINLGEWQLVSNQDNWYIYTRR